MTRFSALYLLLVVGLAAPASINPTSAQPIPATSDYAEEDCYVSGLIGKMRCYEFVRPLSEGGSKNIILGGVIVPADAVVPEADPLVILAGGPGEAASDYADAFSKLFRKINNGRDLIFFDIRGTGRSNPVACTDEDEDVPPLTQISHEEMVDAVRECYSGIEDVVETFTTKTAVADLEALRVALGVQQFNLWGGSYGTRLAQYYVYAHPDHVRSAILDAVVPFTPSYIPLQPGHGLDALNRMSAACAEDDACAAAFPDFDPVALLDQIGDQREISYRHPVTGLPVTTTTSRTAVAGAIGGALYSSNSRIFIPYVLTQAVERDNWAPLSVLAADAGRYMGVVAIYTGPFLSTTCAEESDNINKPALTADPFFRGATAARMRSLCDIWPVDRAPLPAPEEGTIAVPTYMISGDHDPITPPVLAEHAARAFSNVRHYRLKNGGHINSRLPCVSDFLAEFIRDPEDDSLTPQCIADSHVPAFVVGPADPASRGDEK